ncbi:glycosyltransferase family 2 protein [Vibrio harveyi]|uniref:glycosyltransferase family 2 protein n=1 Tax=Vibrio harveyi TaxID=669 RepID=UPI0010FFB3BF|nr:glycosyltransferase family 2 protein [Vibrio harveyi]GEA21807.1 glycosyl transferase family 2 [Vibrio harveyi]HDM8072053.1 glycosyltransferase family 2 protein [Vibrio harveyi]
MRRNPNTITCLLPAYNEEKNISYVIKESYIFLKKYCSDVEILVVDDGSTDETVNIVKSLAGFYPISLVKLSRNFGKEIAISAGLDNAQGDVVIIMDSDGQHPLHVIDQFIELWRDGYDMVYGVRKNRDSESIIKRNVTTLYYYVMDRISDIHIPPNAGDFRLMNHNVVEALKSLPERTRMMKGLYAWVGFKSKAVTFEVEDRLSGNSTFNFYNLASLAMTGLTSFSSAPLKVWMLVGLVISSFSFFYGLIILLKTLFLGSQVPGWPTLTIAIFFLGGIQLLSIGIIGDYISRVFNEVKNRPLYIIEEYKKSSDI